MKTKAIKVMFCRKSLLLIFLLITTSILTALMGGFEIPVVHANPDVSAWLWIEGGGPFPTPSWLFKGGIGESFTIEIWVWIDPPVHLYAWEVKLGWNATMLDYKSASEGDFLKTGGGTTWGSPDLHQEDGWVRLCCTLTDGVPGVTDDGGVIATVEFTVEEAGGSLLDLYDTKMLEPNTSPPPDFLEIPHDPEDGYFANVAFLYVSPGFPMKQVWNPGDEFAVNVWIYNVTDLFAFGFKLSWFYPPPLLEATSVSDGGFLTQGALVSIKHLGDVVVGKSRTSTPGDSGNGVLATITFKVLDGGNCTLELEGVQLINSALESTPCVVANGHFSTTVPRAFFTVVPPPPPTTSYAANQTVTLNATASFNPEGGNATYPRGITSYDWTFQRGGVAGPIEHQETVTTPTIEYEFKKNATYRVTLSVTDLEDESWNYSRSISIVYRDIAITNIYASHTIALPGDLVTIYVTVENLGTGKETFNVTAYYFNSTHTIAVDTIAETLERHPVSWPYTGPPYNKTLEFIWDTDAMAPGDYTVKAEVDIIADNNMTNNESIDDIVTIGFSSAISIFLSNVTITLGESTVIDGSITPVREEATVTIWYRPCGEETWNILTAVLTDENSQYSYTWTPSETGIYELKASWPGDENTLGAESSIVTVEAIPPRILFIKLSGEHDYLSKEKVKIRLAALVKDTTMEPISNANVTIDIYDPNGDLWVSDMMVERLAGTGVYEWESEKTIKELRLEKGVYLAHVSASSEESLTAFDILEFHIDPPAEGSSGAPMYYLIAVVALLVAVAGLILLRRPIHSRFRRAVQ